jgi:hypothetical protein
MGISNAELLEKGVDCFEGLYRVVKNDRVTYDTKGT